MEYDYSLYGNTDFSNTANENMELRKIAESMKIPKIMEAFSMISNLYSVFVNLEGQIIFAPTGPATNLGDFYDLFEKPEYKEYYKHIKETTLNSDEPVIVEREEGGAGRLLGAPVTIFGETKGIWILGSYTVQESEKLKEIADNHLELTKIISDYFEKSISMITESEDGTNHLIRKESTRQKIINDTIIRAYDQNMTDNENMELTFQEVLKIMHLDVVAYYCEGSGTRESKPSVLVTRDEVEVSPEIINAKPAIRAQLLKMLRNYQDRIVVDGNHKVASAVATISKFGLKSVVVEPLFDENHVFGMLVFGSIRKERNWSDIEIEFVRAVKLALQGTLLRKKNTSEGLHFGNELIEVFEGFRSIAFVRNAKSGEILYSNKRYLEAFGYDPKGIDSRTFLMDSHDIYDYMDGMRNTVDSGQKISRMTKYIAKLDQIMDITQIPMLWKGEPAYLVVMNKSNS